MILLDGIPTWSPGALGGAIVFVLITIWVNLRDRCKCGKCEECEYRKRESKTW